MKCIICDSHKLVKFLDKNAIAIWTGSDDKFFRNHKVECKIFQCKECGHIQQFPSVSTDQLLEEIYSSTSAQASSSLGDGNWGLERAKLVFDEINIDSSVNSVLEIGCADGFMLKYLQSLGIKEVEGIEPSLDKSCQINGMKLHKAFATKFFSLDRKFDFIYSICVFEHIQNMNDIMGFVDNHLSDKGILFFEVPNGEISIRFNDPNLFIHEHIHYYTKKSLCTLLKRNGFKLLSLEEKRDSFFVYATKSNDIQCTFESVETENYQTLIEQNIKRIESISQSMKIGFHGVNNSLNNLLGWSTEMGGYKLFDNDEKKIGKTYFDQEVLSPNIENLLSIDCIIVLPIWYFESIKSQYELINPNLKVIKAVEVE
jgi:SAM-dependent methyltransferase